MREDPREKPPLNPTILVYFAQRFLQVKSDFRFLWVTSFQCVDLEGILAVGGG